MVYSPFSLRQAAGWKQVDLVSSAARPQEEENFYLNQELRELVTEVVNKEMTALLREHNDVIHMQREEITTR